MNDNTVETEVSLNEYMGCYYDSPILDSPCPHPRYNDSEHCIFHSPDMEKKESDFRTAFEELVSRIEVNSEYDFHGFVFPSMAFDSVLGEGGFVGSVDFRFAKFTGNADFGGVHFSGNADFENAHFLDDADFSDVRFSGLSYFGRVRFSGDLFFGGEPFSSDAYFEDSQFSGDAVFLRVKFPGEANFNETFIGKKMSFVAPAVDLLSLNSLSGSGSLILSNVNSTKNSGQDISRVNLEHIDDFAGKISLKNMKMSNVRFAESDLSAFEFYHLTWSTNGKREMLLADERDVFKEIYKDFRISKSIIAQRIYTQLKTKFASDRQYQLADAAQYGELEMRLLQKEETGEWFSFEKAYKWTSDYGNSWKRPLWFWFGALIFLLGAGVLIEIMSVKDELFFTLDYSKWIPEICYALDHGWRTMLFAPTTGIKVSFFTALFSVVAKYFGALMIGFSAFAVRRKFRA